MTKAKAKLFLTLRRAAVKVEAGDTKGALRTLGFLALRLERFELHYAKGYRVDEVEHLSVPERRERLLIPQYDIPVKWHSEPVAVPVREVLIGCACVICQPLPLHDEDNTSRRWEPHTPGRRAE